MNDKNLNLMINMLNALTPEHPDYDRLLGEIQVLLTEEEERDREATNERLSGFQILEERKAEIREQMKEKQRFSRPVVIDEKGSAIHARSTPGARLVKEAVTVDPNSEGYLEYIEELKLKAEELNSNPAVKSFLEEIETKERKRGVMVARHHDEVTPITDSSSKSLSEQILSIGVYLPAAELALKQDLIRIGQKVKTLETRMDKFRKLLDEEA